jgi:hypothetical protein
MPEEKNSRQVFIDEYGIPNDADGNLILPSDLLAAAEQGTLLDSKGNPMSADELEYRMYHSELDAPWRQVQGEREHHEN